MLISFLFIEPFTGKDKALFYIAAASGLSAAAVLSVIYSLFLRKNRERKAIKSPRLILLLLAASSGFILCLGISRLAVNPAWSGLPLDSVASFRGRAVSDSRKLPSGSYILEMRLTRTADIHGAEAEAGGKVLVFFREDPQIFTGQLLRIEAGLSADEAYRSIMLIGHAGGTSLLQNEPVLSSFCSASCGAGCAERKAVERLGWHSAVFSGRAAVLRKIKQRCSELGPGAGGLFAALFTGCRDGLSGADTAMFRKAGCSHVLALSGMHLGIISGILLLLLKKLPGRKPAFIISCSVILFYLFLTGFGVSLVRAAVMYFFCGLSYALYRKQKAFDVLKITFIVTVCIMPATFYSLSFQLSFLAVGGIILFTPMLHRLLKPWFPAYLSLPLSCSAAAQLTVSPLLLKVFGLLYPAGLIAGIIIAPMVTVFICAGIMFLCTGFVPVAAAV